MNANFRRRSEQLEIFNFQSKVSSKKTAGKIFIRLFLTIAKKKDFLALFRNAADKNEGEKYSWIEQKKFCEKWYQLFEKGNFFLSLFKKERRIKLLEKRPPKNQWVFLFYYVHSITFYVDAKKIALFGTPFKWVGYPQDACDYGSPSIYGLYTE